MPISKANSAGNVQRRWHITSPTSHIPPAVHLQHHAGDERGFVGSEVEAGVGDARAGATGGPSGMVAMNLARFAGVSGSPMKDSS